MTTLICTIASAILLFFRDYYWPLAWVAPIPLLWLAYSRYSFRMVIVATFGAIIVSQGAIIVRYVSAEGSQIVPPVAIIAVIIVGMGLVLVTCLGMARVVQRQRSPVLTLFAYPLLWVSVSYLWELLAGGDSYGLPAYSQVDLPVFIQSASIFGMWGIEFILALFANALTLAYCDRQHLRLYVAVATAVFLGNLALGIIRLQAPAEIAIRVGAAGQDIPLNQSLPLGAERVMDSSAAYAAEARSLATRGAQIIVFPELTSVLTPDWRSQALAPLATASTDTGSWITMGFADVNGSNEYRNVALTFTPQNEPVRYVKRHTLRPLDTSIRGQSSGILSHGRAVAICKDMDFPATIRTDAQSTIQLMIVPAADFEFDRWTHARMAIMRGVENGFSMVRAARNGLLTVTDDRGRLLARAATNEQRMTDIVAQVPLGTASTIYRRIGDLFAWICLVFAVVLSGLSLYRYVTASMVSSTEKSKLRRH